MPVNSTHADYDATASAWSRARDVLSGEDAVKAGGERYLTRLDSQTDEEYFAYRNRASFFNATFRTAEGEAPDAAPGVLTDYGVEFVSDIRSA